MGLQDKRTVDPRTPQKLPEELPDIELHHGSAIWVLTRLGFRGTASDNTFNEYIKSLRKLGIPFALEKKQVARRGLSKIYSYDHMMELALVLSLQVYHAMPIRCSLRSSDIARFFIATTGRRMWSAARAQERQS